MWVIIKATRICLKINKQNLNLSYSGSLTELRGHKAEETEMAKFIQQNMYRRNPHRARNLQKDLLRGLLNNKLSVNRRKSCKITKFY